MLMQTDPNVDYVKKPPNSMSAEQSVLGSLLMDNQTYDSIADKLSEQDFYYRNHQLIYRSVCQLAQKQMPFDIVTLSDILKASGDLDAAGGLPYLIMLLEDTPTAANILAYAGIVRDRSVLRQLIHVSTNIADAAFNPEGRDAAELINLAEREVLSIAEQGQKNQSGFVGIKSLLVSTVNRIEELFNNDSDLTGASTGFTDFDKLTSGLQPADLIIVAGRPSSGKTTIAMNMAENFALKNAAPVLVFSMEMPSEALTMRMLSSIGRIPHDKIRTGKLEDHDWPRLTAAISQLAQVKLFIDDTPALNVTEIRARAKRIARENGQIGLVVVDYLQLMQSPSSGDNRVQQISDISRGLKALAKELNTPVVALSQLNRNLEQRPNKRPVMSDLRDSGAIEQDADLIAFVYRDEVYNADSPDKGTAEIIIGKQRNGPLGMVRLAFRGEFTRFDNLEHYA